MTRQTTLWIVAAAGGFVSGLLGIHGLAFLGWGVMLVWLAATIALGMAAGSKVATALRLGTYGFVTGFSFMCFGYDGEAALVSRVVPFAIIGLFSGVCAILSGGLVRLMIHRRRRSATPPHA